MFENTMPDEHTLSVNADPSRLIARLRSQRDQLQSQVDILEIAYTDQLEQNKALMDRVTELEESAPKD